MTFTRDQSTNGIHLISVEKEEEVVDLFKDIYDVVYVNFGFQGSIKVPEYYKENRLSYTPSSIESASDFPNKLLSAALSLLEKTKLLVIGTAGLSENSIQSIKYELQSRDKSVVIVTVSRNQLPNLFLNAIKLQ